MRKYLKNILYKSATFINCFIIMLIFIFMANGYAMLKTNLNIAGNSVITTEEWKPKMSYVQTGNLANMFFYNIVIYNNSKLDYQHWQLKIYDSPYVSFVDLSNGERTDYGYVLNNFNWDNRIESKGTTIISIIFQVDSSVESLMTVEEYANYFVRNYIKISGKLIANMNREGTIINNGKATLTLQENEIQVTNFVFEENKEYVPDSPNKKQYILTINNVSDINYLKIRINIYLGTNNTFSEVSPNEILCKNSTNVTIVLPAWLEVESGKAASIYITVVTSEENFTPDIIIAAHI